MLLSFHTTQSSGWLWAVDRHGVDVYPIPGFETLKAAVADFARAAQSGDARCGGARAWLYKLSSEAFPPATSPTRTWLLELDGPLFDLPFAALVVGN